MAEPALPPHIQALLSPDAYSHPTGEIELRQTHISYLLFAGDFVYKVKKPLDLGFLDFSTLEKRRHYCEQEVRLNRRLCQATYLGVVPIAYVEGDLKVDAQGSIVEYGVKMRRLPDGGMMTPLLERDAVTPDMVSLLARTIAEFHASSERSDEIDQYGRLETALVNWRENFEQTEPYIGRTITRHQFDEIQAFVESVAEDDADLFEQREREGRARDCHGDLRADAVCFVDDGVCIFDCIEFNERFRFSDVAADIAFLAMDLEDRGRQDLSDVLMGRYLGATHDSTLPLVLPFYKCYRAYVRGKVDGFQLDQPEIDEAQKARVAEGCRRYFALAHRYATELTPRTLIITIGVTGSGKSHLANALAARLGALILSSDVTRKRLLGIESTERHWDAFEQGIYTPEITERAYQALLDEARPWLERGKPVVLDAAYLSRAQREGALRLAFETDARFLALECEADESVVWERLSERRGEERVVSDGRWEIYQAQQERREPIDELPFGSHMVVETGRPLHEQIDAVVAHLGLAGERDGETLPEGQA
jgi:aminoglycoside phosphotransferase family enzyme/predicted kinase